MTDIHQQIAELEAQIAALKEQAAKKGRWKPETGEDYWVYYAQDLTSSLFWTDDTADRGNFSIGNCFQTKEAALSAYQRRVEYVAITDTLNEISGYFVPDWDDTGQIKWGLIFDYAMGAFRIQPTTVYRYNSWTVFPSEETALEALDLGDKLLPLLHGGW